MSPLQELLARAAVATEPQLARALAALERGEIEAPRDGYLSIAEICRRYRGSRGVPLAKSTVYRKMAQIGVAKPAKKIGGESFFAEADVVRAFDPAALQRVG